MAFGTLDQVQLSQFITRESSPGALWIFLHIPRTAGSSFIAEFADLRPNNKALRIDPTGEQISNAKKMDRVVEQFARDLETSTFKACSGHIKMTHVTRIRSVEPGAKVISLIRNPVDRVVSDFRHARTPAHPPYREFIRKYPTIGDYVDAPESRNKMSRFLAPRAGAELSELLETIDDEFTFIGLTEMYPMSFNIISRLLGQNRFPKVHKQAVDSTSENAVTVDAALRRRIIKNNETDAQLYEHVKTRLVAKRPEWQELLHFEKRSIPETAKELPEFTAPAKRKKKGKPPPVARKEHLKDKETLSEPSENEDDRFTRARVAGLIHRVRWLEHERKRMQAENSRLSQWSQTTFASARSPKGERLLERVCARRAAFMGALQEISDASDDFASYASSVRFEPQRLASYMYDMNIQNSRSVSKKDKAFARAIRDLFNPDYYVRANEVPPAEAKNPLLHYVRHGSLKRFRPNPLFDSEYYNLRTGEIAGDSLLHYCTSGDAAAANPHPLFDVRFYAEQYVPAKAGSGNPLVHYQTNGCLQRLDPSPLFDTSYYLSFFEYPDDIESPLEHYILNGADSGPDPHPLFSASSLRSSGAEIFHEAPLVFYLKDRALQFARDPHPLFSLRQLMKIGCVSRDDPRSPLEQYLAASTERDIDPHPAFDSGFYRYQVECERGVKLGVAPIIHYLTVGFKDKTLRPHPLFDPAIYLKSNQLEPDGPELVRYLSRKDGEGMRCHELFDSRFYDLQRSNVPDRRELTALEHWIGDAERKLPTDARLRMPLDSLPLQLIARAVSVTEEFDADFYRDLYREFAEYDVSAAREHYEKHGKGEGRHGSARSLLTNTGFGVAEVPIGFFPSEYVDLHPDLEVWRDQPMRCFLHYFEHGRAERRQIGFWQLKIDGVHLDDAAPETSSLPQSRGPRRLCVLVHVYYPELWPELASFVRNLRVVAADVFINVADTQWTPQVQEQLRELCPDAFVLVSENRGRDVGGHLRLLDNIDIERYEAFALLHTKRSRHLAAEKGEAWRQSLIASFAGSEAVAAQCVDMFREHPKTGIIGAAAWRAHSMNGNQVLVDRLMARFDIEAGNRRLDFVSGTMFMIRSDIVSRLHRELRDIVWEDATGRDSAFFLDGQLEHAVERVIPSLARQMGYELVWR